MSHGLKRDDEYGERVEVAVSALVAIAVAVITSVATARLERSKLRAEYRTQFMAETALTELLDHPSWKQRSFEQIRRRVGGFEDNELRQLLVRAGALRFEAADGTEYWGLRRRNTDSLEAN